MASRSGVDIAAGQSLFGPRGHRDGPSSLGEALLILPLTRKTTLVLVNTGASAAGAHLKFFDDNGSPLLLPLSFPQTGNQSPASQVDTTIAANASLVIESL